MAKLQTITLRFLNKIILFWNRKTKKQKMVFITTFIFILLFIIFIFINTTISLNVSEDKNLPKNFPRTEVGLWSSFKIDGKLLAYPPDWTARPHLGDKGKIDYVTLIPPSKKGQAPNPDDVITVGGQPCSELKVTLCVGNEPVFTNSRDASVMQIFNIIVKHIYRYDAYRKIYK